MEDAWTCTPLACNSSAFKEVGNNVAIISLGMSWDVDSRRLCYTQTTHHYALREDYHSLPEILAAPLVDKYLGT